MSISGRTQSLFPDLVTRQRPKRFTLFLFESIVLREKFPLHTLLGKMSIQIKTEVGKASLRYLISDFILFLIFMIDKSCKSFPPKWITIAAGGEESNTWAWMECRNPLQRRPLVPHQATVLPSIFKFGFPVAFARSPAQNGIESPTIQISEIMKNIIIPQLSS